MSAQVTTTGDVLAGDGLPAWLTGSPLFEWIEIAGTTHAGSAGDPTSDGRSNSRLAFCNLALYGSELILAATGGHSDYFGNEVTGIDVSDDAPAWVLRKARTELVNVTLDTDPAWVGYNADGTPSSRHTYNSVHYSTTHSRLMLHRTRFSYPSADSDNATNGFNLTSNTWDAAGTWAAGQTAACRDGSDNCWTISAAYLKKWTAATDTWSAGTAVVGYNAGNGEPTMCYDSTGDRLVLLKLGDGLGFGGTDVVCATFAMDGTQTDITMSAGSAAAVAQFQADLGTYAVLEHDPDNNVFWYWSAMSATNGVAYLYKLTPNGTTTWDLSIQTVSGTPPVNIGPDTAGTGGHRVGAHGRMCYVPAIKSLVFMTAGTENLFAVRTA